MKIVFSTHLRFSRLICCWFCSCHTDPHHLDVGTSFDMVDHGVWITHSVSHMELSNSFWTSFRLCLDRRKYCWQLAFALHGSHSSSNRWKIHWNWRVPTRTATSIVGTGGFLLGRLLCTSYLIWFNIVMGSRSNRTLTTFHSACHPSCLLFCFLHNAFAMAVYSSISSNWLQQTPMEVEYILVGHIRYSQELGRHWHHDSLTWINLRPFASTCCVRYAY